MINSNSSRAFNVLIAGGGVAALEAALVLREHGGERIATTILAPDPDFVYRPMTVREPFGYRLAKRYPLERIARDIGAELCAEKFAWVDPVHQVVHTEAGTELRYDALLLALGAARYTLYEHSITLDDRRLDEQLHGLIQDIEGGYIHKLAFIVPPGAAWPLPIYELALMTAARAQEMYADVSITIATPEDAPLAIFGEVVSDSVGQLLKDNGILTLLSAHGEVREHGHITFPPGSEELFVDRIITLPQLFGPPVAGVPRDARDGFIPVDTHGKVRGLDRVYAAGDATDFPIKFGGIAAQQADVAAQAIAALAGLAAEPAAFRPELQAVLLTGGRPLHLSAVVSGGHGVGSLVTESPSWAPEGKIAAKHLGPYLRELDAAASLPT